VTAAIVTHGLTKRFGPVTAVDGVDLTVPEGAVFGFLGPNGSGKTTTIRLLLGLVTPTSGAVEVLGQPMPAAAGAVLPLVGALVEGPAFYPWLTGRQNMARRDALSDAGAAPTRNGRIDSALARVGLTAAADKRYRAYSAGMRQRLGLAAALLRPRRLLVLDEPTNTLDPQGTREVRALIGSLAADGMTVFLSSHLLAEIDQVCTHAAVLRDGQTVAQGTIGEVRGRTGRRLRVETAAPARAVAALATVAGLGRPSADGDVVVAELGGATPEGCFAALAAAAVPVRALTTELPGLEEAFVALTGEGFDVSG